MKSTTSCVLTSGARYGTGKLSAVELAQFLNQKQYAALC